MTTTAKTIQQLIAEGLKRGTLLKMGQTIYQYDGDSTLWLAGTNRTFKVSEFNDSKVFKFRFEITTVCDLDGQISREDLRFDEPLDATGWVVCDGYKFEPIAFDTRMAEDGYHQLYYWGVCYACLPFKR
jgi:hypothetical protein